MQPSCTASFVEEAAALLERSAAEHEQHGRTASAKHQRRAAAGLRAARPIDR